MLKMIYNSIRNDKNRYIGLIIEQIFVFIIILICIVSVLKLADKYLEPGLLDTDDVVTFGYTAMSLNNADDVEKKMNIFIEELKRNQDVNYISKSFDCVPYSKSDDYQHSDSVKTRKKKILSSIKAADIYWRTIFKPTLIAGNWFTENAKSQNKYKAIVNKDFAEAMGVENVIGEKVSWDNGEFIIIGVTDGYKNNVFKSSNPAIILHTEYITFNRYSEYSVRVKDIRQFTTKLYKKWQQSKFDPRVQLYIIDSSESKELSMLEEKQKIVLQAVPTIFLLIFAFIGTFGIFWLNSQKRTREFALRLAIGSTKRGLMWLVIKESIIISTISMIPGLLLSFFIYEFTMPEIIGIGTTIVIMLLFAIFSAWYPAYRVSKINPAEAIKYE